MTGYSLTGHAVIPSWTLLLIIVFGVLAMFGMYVLGLTIQKARNRDYIMVLRENLARGAAHNGKLAPGRTVSLALVLEMLEDMEDDLGD